MRTTGISSRSSANPRRWWRPMRCTWCTHCSRRCGCRRASSIRSGRRVASVCTRCISNRARCAPTPIRRCSASRRSRASSCCSCAERRAHRSAASAMRTRWRCSKHCCPTRGPNRSRCRVRVTNVLDCWRTISPRIRTTRAPWRSSPPTSVARAFVRSSASSWKRRGSASPRGGDTAGCSHPSRCSAEGRGIGEVAQAVGYESATAFSTAFKQCFGVSPSSYT